MTMDPRIEKLAGEPIALPLAELSAGEITERIAATLGDADPDVAQAALDLAAELVRQRTADAAKHAETLLTIFRLANATHCPDGTNAVTWLQGLGLIEPDGAGWYMVTPQASTRVVGDGAGEARHSVARRRLRFAVRQSSDRKMIRPDVRLSKRRINDGRISTWVILQG